MIDKDIKIRIGIIGMGFVGKTISEVFIKNTDIIGIDPKLKTNIKDLVNFKPDIIFVCLPTPMSKAFSQDISILHDVLENMEKYFIDTFVVLKSTVLPNNVSKLSKPFKKFVYNPEFLREKHALEDMINSNINVIGGKKSHCKYLKKIYKNHSICQCKNFSFTDIESAAFVKYTINSFLSLKTSFFNQLFELYNQSNSSDDWNNFIKIVSHDPRIGDSHMSVPGHDGRKGFGGACLPKDSKAFVDYSKEMDKFLSILNEAIKSNNKIRSQYGVDTHRETEQNIEYND